MKIQKAVRIAVVFLIGIAVSGTVMGQTYTVTVTANPLWTDAGLYLNAGNIVSITATGLWSYYNLYDFFGPDGKVGVPSQDGFLAGANEACLLAFVGSNPYQGHWGDSNFFPQATGYWAIGSSNSFSAPYMGELWLGINDDAISKNVSDNSGALTAFVVVPEPTSMSLLAFGTFGALVLLRHRR